MASTKVSLKFLIDESSNEVLFAEAGKDFIDFLFNLLSLPVGTIVRLLTKNAMVGCLANLYESVENLDDTYIQPDQTKDILLKPKVPTSSSTNLSGFLLPVNEEGDKPVTPKLYVCNAKKAKNRMMVNVCGDGCNYYVTEDSESTCPSCGSTMDREAKFVGKRVRKETSCGEVESGFVKGVVTFIVMDDLVVLPMSIISSITLLNKFNVKKVGSLREMVVTVDTEEGVKLLKASLQCKLILTNVPHYLIGSPLISPITTRDIATSSYTSQFGQEIDKDPCSNSHLSIVEVSTLKVHG